MSDIYRDADEFRRLTGILPPGHHEARRDAFKQYPEEAVLKLLWKVFSHLKAELDRIHQFKNVAKCCECGAIYEEERPWLDSIYVCPKCVDEEQRKDASNA